jgi:glutamate synthase domain-containing protein 2
MQKGFWKSWIKSDFYFAFCTEHKFWNLRIEQNIHLNIPYTPSRIEGIGLMEIEKKSKDIKAFPNSKVSNLLHLSGVYRWRRSGEKHMFNPTTLNYNKLFV